MLIKVVSKKDLAKVLFGFKVVVKRTLGAFRLVDDFDQANTSKPVLINKAKPCIENSLVHVVQCSYSLGQD